MVYDSVNNKRIAKNTLYLYVRMFFLIVVNLYTSRVVLTNLGVIDYGLYNVIGGMVALMTFFTASLTTASQRYLTYMLGTNDEDKLRTTFSTIFFITIVVSLFTAIVIEGCGVYFINNKLNIPQDRLNAVFWLLQFSIVTCVISFLSIPYNACLIAHEKMSALAAITILESLLKLFAAVVVVYISFDKLVAYGFLLACVFVVIRMIYSGYCRKHFEESSISWSFDKSLVKELSKFMGWSLLPSIAGMSYTQGLNVLLNMFFDPAVNAARGVTVQVQAAIVNFATSFQTAINPQITKNYASGNLTYMKELVFKSSKLSFFLVLVIAIPIWLEIDFILKVWLVSPPHYSGDFIRIIIFIVFCNTMMNPIQTAVLATAQIKKYHLSGFVILMLILPFSYTALKLGAKPYIVFVIHLAMELLSDFVRIVLVRKQIELDVKQYAKNVLFPIGVVSVITIMVNALYAKFVAENLFFNHPILNMFISVIVTILSIWCLGLNSKEKSFVVNMIKSRIKG